MTSVRIRARRSRANSTVILSSFRSDSLNVQVVLKRLLPGFECRLLLRRTINLPRDTFEFLTGRRDPLIAPHGLWFVGGEKDYKMINEEFMRYFVELGGLHPNHRVLDVGCGIGIMAARLSRFLNAQGSYDGFDIVRAGIRWAGKHITPRFPNFRFSHANVYNRHYNPKGDLDPDSFRFPYPDCSFDFVFLKSVFTHMRPAGVQHYFREIRRVLKPTGSCLATAFLLTGDSTDLIRRGRSSLSLIHNLGGYSVLDPMFPETAVGVPEQSFREWYENAGLMLQPPIHYGSWCGRGTYKSFQDILVLCPII
jgi:ubiquinone/menaquinone biosynthesis C-methylase UbiE